jgi:hypothetical protein
MWKFIAIFCWVVITSGFLWLLSEASDGDSNFLVFLILAFGGNMAYDLHPLYRSDWKKLCLKAWRGLGLLLLSFTGIAAEIFALVPMHLGLALWAVFYILSLRAFVRVERFYGVIRPRAWA